MSCEEGEMRRRRLPSSPSVAAPLDDDDLLSEILLRLPPLPSSLPRASAVCKRWRGLVTHPRFLRRFRLRHRHAPPLLGFFHRGAHGLSFVTTLEAPNRVPPGRFSLRFDGRRFRFLGCRHGLVLIFDETPLQFLVWDPVTGQQHRLPIPPGFDPTLAMVNGAVLRSAAAGDVQHFKVVLVVGKLDRVLARVYSSESGVWGNLISTPNPSQTTSIAMRPAVLVGDSLYWALDGGSLNCLEFDLVRDSLAMLWMPSGGGFSVMRAEGGVLGLLSVSRFTAQLWKRRINSDGVASWGAGITIELDKLLSLNPDDRVTIEGFAEDNNLLFLWTSVSLFTVQLESLQFKEIPKPEIQYLYHPFECVYAAGI